MSEKCLYSEIFWSVFSRIRTEYGEIRSDSVSISSRLPYYLNKIKQFDSFIAIAIITTFIINMIIMFIINTKSNTKIKSITILLSYLFLIYLFILRAVIFTSFYSEKI